MSILIIEDDEGLGELVSRIAVKCGHKVHLMTTAKDALAWLAGNAPSLMLLDYMLPDMDAQAFLTELTKRNIPLPPFIITSGQDDELVANELMRKGAKAFIVKDRSFLERLPGAIGQA